MLDKPLGTAFVSSADRVGLPAPPVARGNLTCAIATSRSCQFEIDVAILLLADEHSPPVPINFADKTSRYTAAERMSLGAVHVNKEPSWMFWYGTC